MTCAVITLAIIQNTNQDISHLLKLLPLLSHKTPIRTYYMCFNYPCNHTRHQPGHITCALNLFPCYHTRHQPGLITFVLITLVIIQDTNQDLSHVLEFPLLSYKTPARTYCMCFNCPCYHTRHQSGLIACASIAHVIIKDTSQDLLHVLQLPMLSYKTPARTYCMCFKCPCYHTRHQPGLIACASIAHVIIQDTSQDLLHVLQSSMLSYKTPARTYCMCFKCPCYHTRHQPGLIACASIANVIIQDTSQDLLHVLQEPILSYKTPARTYCMCFNCPCYNTRHQPGLIACASIAHVIILDTSQDLLHVLQLPI